MTRCVCELLTHIGVTCVNKLIQRKTINFHASQSPTLIIIKFYCNCSLHRNHLDNRIFHHKLIPPVSIVVHTEIYF